MYMIQNNRTKRRTISAIQPIALGRGPALARFPLAGLNLAIRNRWYHRALLRAFKSVATSLKKLSRAASELSSRSLSESDTTNLPRSCKAI